MWTKKRAIALFNKEHSDEEYTIVEIHHNVYAKYDYDSYRDYIHVGRFIEHKPIYINDVNAYYNDYKRLNHRVY